MNIAEILLTLLIGLFFILLGTTNPEPIAINFFHIRTLQIQVSVLLFIVFLIGAAYVAFWTVIGRMRAHWTINHLKKKLEVLEAEAGNDARVAEGASAPAERSLEDAPEATDGSDADSIPEAEGAAGSAKEESGAGEASQEEDATPPSPEDDETLAESISRKGREGRGKENLSSVMRIAKRRESSRSEPACSPWAVVLGLANPGNWFRKNTCSTEER